MISSDTYKKFSQEFLGMTQILLSFSNTTSSRMIFSCKISTLKCKHEKVLHTSISVVREYATEETDNFSEFFFFLINNFLVQEKNKSQKRTGRTTLHLLYKRAFSKRYTIYLVHRYVKPYHNHLSFHIYSTTFHAQLPNISYKGGGGVL